MRAIASHPPMNVTVGPMHVTVGPNSPLPSVVPCAPWSTPGSKAHRALHVLGGRTAQAASESRPSLGSSLHWRMNPAKNQSATNQSAWLPTHTNNGETRGQQEDVEGGGSGASSHGGGGANSHGGGGANSHGGSGANSRGGGGTNSGGDEHGVTWRDDR